MASALPGEFALIARYFAPLSRGFPGAFGLLDDAAVITPGSGTELVVKTDAIVGGIDFPVDTPAGLIARKALRVNLSDLAAKGAVPRAYMLDLILPPSVNEDWIAAFAAGLAQDQAEFGVHLIGGDMSATPGPATIAVMAFGEVPDGRIIRRSGARAGDSIFVTGTIGDAALGLAALNDALPGLGADLATFLRDRYQLPRPRVELGPRLIGIASAALDVSDGLIADLRHVCETSKLAATVEAARVPLSEAARTVLTQDPAHLSIIFAGGDDYEIVFTVPQTSADAIVELARSSRVPITRIGKMAAPLRDTEYSVHVVDAIGRPIALASQGWTHF